MKQIAFCILLAIGNMAFSQSTYENEIREFQNELNEEFLNPKESPLSKKERRKFKGHHYFPIDGKFRITAEFIKSDNPEALRMKTSTGQLPAYDKFGKARFTLDGQQFELSIYQSHRLRQTEEYKDYLFLPFTDLTNGEETYGGGRYISLHIPEGNEIIIDFNKAYSPSCAYNHSYSCPIPPAENDLKIRIEAGVMNLEL